MDNGRKKGTVLKPANFTGPTPNNQNGRQSKLKKGKS
jgi:hypothetical protein